MKTDRGFSDSEASTVVLVSPLETSDSDVEAAGDPEEMVREFFNCVVRREPNASQAGSFVRLANKHGEVLERAGEVARANLLRMGKAQARIKELETRVLQLENKLAKCQHELYLKEELEWELDDTREQLMRAMQGSQESPTTVEGRRHQIRVLNGRVQRREEEIRRLEVEAKEKEKRINELSDSLLRRNVEIRKWRLHSIEMSKMLDEKLDAARPITPRSLGSGCSSVGSQAGPSSGRSSTAGMPAYAVRNLITAAVSISSSDDEVILETKEADEQVIVIPSSPEMSAPRRVYERLKARLAASKAGQPDKNPEPVDEEDAKQSPAKKRKEYKK